MLSEAPFRSRIKARQTCPGLQVPKVTIQNISINLHGSQIHAAGRGKSWKLKVPPAKLSLSPSCTAVSTEPRNSVRTRDPAPHRQRQRCRAVLRPHPGPTGAPGPMAPLTCPAAAAAPSPRSPGRAVPSTARATGTAAPLPSPRRPERGREAEGAADRQQPRPPPTLQII